MTSGSLVTVAGATTLTNRRLTHKSAKAVANSLPSLLAALRCFRYFAFNPTFAGRNLRTGDDSTGNLA
jgi:hypothetical protein